VSFAYLKHHLDFVRVGFVDALHAENEFAWRFVTLKHRIIDLSKVVF
jgi:hypothetical protein